jgi:MFS family permease
MAVRRAFHATFRSLHVRNYRLFFFGQIVSLTGTWMQSIGQAWLVLRLAPPGRAGVALGLVFALQFLPVLFFASLGGLVADRFDKRLILCGTQFASGVLAAILAVLTATHSVHLWHVYLLAILLGVVTVVDNPTRQSFSVEMVGPDDLPNAVTLNSVILNSARVVGPAIGGTLIALVGIAPCFVANAVSYLAVVGALLLMRPSELYRSSFAPKAKGQLREGIRYVWRVPELRDTLLVVAVAGTLAYNFQVTLALLAKFTFDAGAGGYSALSSALGGGAVVGGLLVASRGRPSLRRVGISGVVFGALDVGIGLAPSLAGALILVALTGAAMIVFSATGNSILQLRADPIMRGRVMALYATAMLGMTPIGSPFIGWVSQVASPRVAMIIAGSAVGLAAGAIWYRYRHRDVDELEPVLHRSEQLQVEPVMQPSEGLQLEPVMQPSEGLQLEPVTQPSKGLPIEPGTLSLRTQTATNS